MATSLIDILHDMTCVQHHKAEAVESCRTVVLRGGMSAANTSPSQCSTYSYSLSCSKVKKGAAADTGVIEKTHQRKMLAL